MFAFVDTFEGPTAVICIAGFRCTCEAKATFNCRMACMLKDGGKGELGG